LIFNCFIFCYFSGKIDSHVLLLFARVKPALFGLLCVWRRVHVLRQQLLGEVWTSLSRPNEFFSIGQHCGPVEGSSEGFAHQCARGHVVVADAFVNLFHDVLAFFPRDALHEYSRSGTPPVELVFD
jgi:hypothetical protein